MYPVLQLNQPVFSAYVLNAECLSGRRYGHGTQKKKKRGVVPPPFPPALQPLLLRIWFVVYFPPPWPCCLSSCGIEGSRDFTDDKDCRIPGTIPVPRSDRCNAHSLSLHRVSLHCCVWYTIKPSYIMCAWAVWVLNLTNPRRVHLCLPSVGQIRVRNLTYMQPFSPIVFIAHTKVIPSVASKMRTSIEGTTVVSHTSST